MRYGLTEVAGSGAPGLLFSLDEAKIHLREDGDAADAEITRKVYAATRIAEQYTRRVFIERQFEMTLEAFPRAAWIDTHAPQDGEVWPPRFGCLTASRRFPDAIVLPVAPLISVDEISYSSTELSGDPEAPVVKTVNGVADRSAWPPRILPTYGQCWPEVACVPEAVKATFTAGYGDSEDVPEDIKEAVKLILGSLYEIRADMMVGAPVNLIPFHSQALLSPYRVFRL